MINRKLAPIDDKNVLSDALMDAVFDESHYIETKGKYHEHVAMGLIDGHPCYIQWSFGNYFFYVGSAELGRFDRKIVNAITSRIDDELIEVGEVEIFDNTNEARFVLMWK